MTIKVKICGITNAADAEAAVEAGADALGFVFHRPSPRYVAPSAVREIVRQLPPFVTRVGVFVDSPMDFVEQTLATCHLDFAQLHGAEDARFCAALHPRAIKGLRVAGADVLRHLEDYDAIAFVLDAYQPGLRGGTGRTFDWRLARQAVDTGRRIILSGGLNAANVAAAIKAAAPYAVDVASGVESSPGKKDHETMRAFVRAAKDDLHT